MSHSPALQEAIEIISMQPIPADADQQLKRLEKKIRKDEASKFGDLWEAIIWANGPAEIPQNQ